MKAGTKRNATTLPATMKATAVDRFGPPSRPKIHGFPVPRPAPDEVLIALDTAGAGIWDAYVCGLLVYRYSDATCTDSLGMPSAISDLAEKEWQAFECQAAARMATRSGHRREQ